MLTTHSQSSHMAGVRKTTTISLVGEHIVPNSHQYEKRPVLDLVATAMRAHIDSGTRPYFSLLIYFAHSKRSGCFTVGRMSQSVSVTACRCVALAIARFGTTWRGLLLSGFTTAISECGARRHGKAATHVSSQSERTSNDCHCTCHSDRMCFHLPSMCPWAVALPV